MSLNIRHLSVSLADREILHDINLEIKKEKVHVLMGPNGSGKSTLAASLLANTQYSIKNPYTMLLDGEHLEDFETEKRAQKGMFLAFQNPVAIPGVTVANLLKVAFQLHKQPKSTHNPVLSVWDFHKMLLEKAKSLSIPQDFLKRSLNEAFSGGEKKKLEMLQALVLSPKYAIFDEIDTGLDVDALKIVASGISQLKKQGTGILVITHYQRILKYFKPDFVHVLVDGALVESGDSKLVSYIEKNGYIKWLKK